MSDKELFEKYAEICDHRQRRLMDVQETAMFCALRDMLNKGAKLAELVNGPTQSTISHDDWYALRNERDRITDRLTEAERLIRVYRFNTPLGNQPSMIADEADKFLRNDDGEGLVYGGSPMTLREVMEAEERTDGAL